jgi:hypothetical protein
MLADRHISWAAKAAALEAIIKMSLPDKVTRIGIVRFTDGWVVTAYIKEMGSVDIIEEGSSEEFPIKNVLDKLRMFL